MCLFDSGLCLELAPGSTLGEWKRWDKSARIRVWHIDGSSHWCDDMLRSLRPWGCAAVSPTIPAPRRYGGVESAPAGKMAAERKSAPASSPRFSLDDEVESGVRLLAFF